jgi:hypothetical protein
MTTLTDLQTMVYNRLGVPTTDGVFTSAVVTGFINDALAEIATEHDWPWLADSEQLSTGAGIDTVTPGTSVIYAGTTNVFITVAGETWPLLRRTYDELVEGYSFTQQGVPEVWAAHRERLFLRPVPDNVYTITHELIKGEDVLSSGADEPFMPDNYSPAIANLAVAIALGRSKEDGRAIAAQTKYDRWLSKMLDNRRRARRPGRIRVRAGSWI